MKILGTDFWIEVFQAFIQVVRRFPFSMASGLSATIAFGILIKLGIHDQELLQERCLRVGLSGGLGMSFFVLAELICERLGGRGNPGGLAVTFVSLGLLVIFALWIPFESGENIYDRFWVFYLSLHLLTHLAIAVVPFWNSQIPNQILWKYNKVLLSKFLIIGFFSAVSFGGMTLALVSIVELFNVDIDENAFGRIWFFCAFVLNTCLLLGSLPKADERDQLQLEYPTWILF